MKTNKKRKFDTAKIYMVFALLFLALFFVCPTELVSDEDIYTLALGGVYEREENLVLYRYEVFATETKFQKGLSKLTETEQQFRENDEILVVKIPGEGRTERKNGYVLIYDNTVPALNIEYYYAKNTALFGSDIPCKTFLTLCYSVADKINLIYNVIRLAVLLAVLLSIMLKIVKSVSVQSAFLCADENRKKCQKYKDMS